MKYNFKMSTKKVEKAAKRQHTSISKWVADQLRSRMDPAYPAQYEELFGSINDETFLEPGEVQFGSDLGRGELYTNPFCREG